MLNLPNLRGGLLIDEIFKNYSDINFIISSLESEKDLYTRGLNRRLMNFIDHTISEK